MSQPATAPRPPVQEPGAGTQASSRATIGGLSGCPKARESDGWMVRIFSLDIDSAYRAANAMAADGDGIVVGVQTLIKRLHESGRLKSVDGQRPTPHGGCRKFRVCEPYKEA